MVIGVFNSINFSTELNFKVNISDFPYLCWTFILSFVWMKTSFSYFVCLPFTPPCRLIYKQQFLFVGRYISMIIKFNKIWIIDSNILISNPLSTSTLTHVIDKTVFLEKQIMFKSIHIKSLNSGPKFEPAVFNLWVPEHIHCRHSGGLNTYIGV